MPRPSPVTMAPRIEPMPPITTTAKTTMMMLEPISGVIWTADAARTPASPASATPKPKVRVTRSGTFTPKAWVRPGFSVAARRYAPSLVRSITNQVAKHTTRETPITQARETGSTMKPRVHTPVGAGGRGPEWRARRRRSRGRASARPGGGARARRDGGVPPAVERRRARIGAARAAVDVAEQALENERE